jgi:hypothetical protein
MECLGPAQRCIFLLWTLDQYAGTVGRKARIAPSEGALCVLGVVRNAMRGAIRMTAKLNGDHACDDRVGVNCATRNFQSDWPGPEDECLLRVRPEWHRQIFSTSLI